jgi:hypothetical protein
MRLYALVKNLVVVECQALTEEQYAELSRTYDSIVDIEDMVPQPESGWVLTGNTFSPSAAPMTADEYDAYRQKAQREFGLKILPGLIDLIGARNLKLEREGTPVDVAAIGSALASVKLLLEGGALRTVCGLCTMFKASFPAHADILDYCIAEVTVFLNEKGF